MRSLLRLSQFIEYLAEYQAQFSMSHAVQFGLSDEVRHVFLLEFSGRELFTAFMTRTQATRIDTAALGETQWRSRTSAIGGTGLRRPGRSDAMVKEK